MILMMMMNVCRQVSISMCPANIILPVLTVLDGSSITAVFINCSFVTLPRHKMPNMVRRYLRWKTANMCEIFAVPFHVSPA